MRERFSDIYATNEWEHGSGEGSLPVHTRGYAAFLQDFIRRHDVRSVVALGCGNWQFSRHLDWSGVQYLGLDIVPSVIDANTRAFARPNIQFRLHDGDIANLPAADLLIVKDVLQHWSNAAIQRLLPQLSRYPQALITNCVNPAGDTVNTDIADGDFRYLDLRLEPFQLAATEVYSFTNKRGLFNRLWGRPRWLKKVLLVAGSPRPAR